jgi:hypothetical protein
MDPNDPQPTEPRFDPTSPSTGPAWQQYAQAMIAWQQRETERATQARGPAPAQAPANNGLFGLFKSGGSRRRSKRSRKSRRTRR